MGGLYIKEELVKYINKWEANSEKLFIVEMARVKEQRTKGAYGLSEDNVK